MQSITQENDLEAFLSTAALAGTEFTAGRFCYMKYIKNFFLFYCSQSKLTCLYINVYNVFFKKSSMFAWFKILIRIHFY